MRYVPVTGTKEEVKIMNLLPELLRGLSDYRMLFYAIVLIVMMLINWAPKAIEMRERLFSKFKKKEA